MSNFRHPTSPSGVSSLLQSYINRVHRLEEEKNRLASQHASSVALVSKLEVSYKNQIQGLEKLVDEISSENVKLHSDSRRITAQLDVSTTELKKVKKERDLLEEKVLKIERDNNSLKTVPLQLKADLDRAVKQQKETAHNSEMQVKLIEKLETRLEEELLSHCLTVHENLTLKEKLAFKAEVDEHLEKALTLPQIELKSVLEKAETNFSQRLKSTLDSLEKFHKKQLTGKPDQGAEQQNTDLFSSASLIVNACLEDGSKVREATLLLANQRLEEEVKKLKDWLNEEKKSHFEATNGPREVLSPYESNRFIQEYQTCRELLEAEEERLNPERANESFNSSPPEKRLRVEYTVPKFQFKSSSVGAVEIAEVNEEGKFIRIMNTGKKSVRIGAWKLVHVANDAHDTMIEYVISPHKNLDPGAAIIVYSAGEGQNFPPTFFVMDQNRRWPVGSSYMETFLYDKSGTEMAKMVGKRNVPEL